MVVCSSAGLTFGVFTRSVVFRFIMVLNLLGGKPKNTYADYFCRVENNSHYYFHLQGMQIHCSLGACWDSILLC